MLTVRFSNKLFILLALCLASKSYAVNFESFWAEFKRSGGGSPSFCSANVKDWPTFWAEFKRSGGYSDSFSNAKVKDFQSFYIEFLKTGRNGPSFNAANVK